MTDYLYFQKVNQIFVSVKVTTEFIIDFSFINQLLKYQGQYSKIANLLNPSESSQFKTLKTPSRLTHTQRLTSLCQFEWNTWQNFHRISSFYHAYPTNCKKLLRKYSCTRYLDITVNAARFQLTPTKLQYLENKASGSSAFASF